MRTPCWLWVALGSTLCFPPGNWELQNWNSFQFLSFDLHLASPYLTQGNMVKIWLEKQRGNSKVVLDYKCLLATSSWSQPKKDYMISFSESGRGDSTCGLGKMYKNTKVIPLKIYHLQPSEGTFLARVLVKYIKMCWCLHTVPWFPRVFWDLLKWGRYAKAPPYMESRMPCRNLNGSKH